MCQFFQVRLMQGHLQSIILPGWRWAQGQIGTKRMPGQFWEYEIDSAFFFFTVVPGQPRLTEISFAMLYSQCEFFPLGSYCWNTCCKTCTNQNLVLWWYVIKIKLWTFFKKVIGGTTGTFWLPAHHIMMFCKTIMSETPGAWLFTLVLVFYRECCVHLNKIHD